MTNGTIPRMGDPAMRYGRRRPERAAL